LTDNDSSLTVCLDARLKNGVSGGVQQFIIGLATGLSRLSDGHEKYVYLCNPGEEEWLLDHLDDPHQVIFSREDMPLRRRIEQIFRLLPFGDIVLEKALHLLGNPVLKLPVSDGTVEAAGAEIMHFTHQSAFRTNLPNIYHPWDLQHLHFPEFFSEQQRLTRDYRYRECCAQARMVAVGSNWMRNEVMNHFKLEAAKVKVIQMAPPVDAYSIPSEDEIEEARRHFSLNEPFLLYPAQTWAHKNHLGLIRALSHLQQNFDIRPLVVCTGRTNDHFAVIKKMLKKIDMTSQVKFLGFISPSEIQSLYRLCRVMVFPSKYEGWGLPVTEALRTGVPIACSRLSILEEQAGNAALYFDPDNPRELAESVYRLWTDPELRRELSEKGRKNSTRFTWEKTARIFRAHYRFLSGRLLNEEDKELVSV
jgi:glycosyltransferase involved in cell wall biosynthesis